MAGKRDRRAGEGVGSRGSERDAAAPSQGRSALQNDFIARDQAGVVDSEV